MNAMVISVFSKAVRQAFLILSNVSNHYCTWATNKRQVAGLHMVWRAILMAALLCAAPSWAVHKCVEPDGKTSYQDTECVAGKEDTLKITDNTSDSDPSGSSTGYSGSANKGRPHSPSERMQSLPRIDPVIYTGPRGGRFHYTESGNKSYVRKGER